MVPNKPIRRTALLSAVFSFLCRLRCGSASSLRYECQQLRFDSFLILPESLVMSTASAQRQMTSVTEPFTLRYVCRECGGVNNRTLTDTEMALVCDACGHRQEGFLDEELPKSRLVERCVVCGNRELYMRKDFKQQIGVFAVTLAVVIATIIYAYTKNIVWTVLVLVASSIIDSILYRFIPDMTACYKCKAEYRGMVRNPEHKAYSHYTGERYRSQAQQSQ